MGLRHDAVLLHLTQLIPCEIPLSAADKPRYNEDRRLEVVFFEDRVGICIVVNITVIKGDEHGAIRKCAFPRKEVVKFVGRNAVIAMVDEILHLPVEVIRLNGK